MKPHADDLILLVLFGVGMVVCLVGFSWNVIEAFVNSVP